MAATTLEPVVATRPRSSYRTDLVTVLLGGWFTIGLLLDAWAHNNVPELETFFTPWHAVFYSGFTATAAWLLWSARAHLFPLRPVRAVRARLPVAYPAALVALAGFAVSGVGDYAWHTVFGIEQHIDILFSPTHLGLITSMLVIVTTPLRAAVDLPRAPGLRQLLPAVLATVFATTQVLLFLQYANGLRFSSGGLALGLANVDPDQTVQVVASMAMTTLVLVVPPLALARRWALPFGTATILFTTTGLLSTAIGNFRNLDLITWVVVAGLLTDVLARALRPSPELAWRYVLFGGLVPLLLWGGLVVDAVSAAPAPEGGLASAIELYTGTPLAQGLLGVLAAMVLRAGCRGG